MSIQVNDNFEVNAPKPVDNRFVVGGNNFYQDKEDIDYKYEGLRIWDLNDNEPYYWTGTAWSSENVAGSVTVQNAVTGFLTKFIGSGGEIETSILFQSDSKIGINTQSPQKALHIRNSGIIIEGNDAVESSPNLERFIIDTGNSTSQNFLKLRNNNGTAFYVGSQGASINTENRLGSRFRVDGSVLIGTGTTPPSNGLYVQGKSIFDGAGTNDGLVEIGDKSVSNTVTPSSKKRLVIYDSQNHISLVQRSLNFGGFFTIENKGWSLSAGNVNSSSFQIRYLEEGDTSDPKFIINSIGNVGIGTTNPGSKLHVVGANQAFISNIENTTSSGSGLLIKSGSNASSIANILRLTNSQNDDVLSVKSNGNVGIGYSSPVGKLSIGGDVSIGTNNPQNNSKLTVEQNSTNGLVIRNINGDATMFQMIRLLGSTRNWGIGLDTDESFKIRDSWQARDRLTISNNGNVGIGVNNPIRQLHIDSASGAPLRVESKSGGAVYMEFTNFNNPNSNNNGRVGYIGVGSSTTTGSDIFGIVATKKINISAGDEIRLRTSSSERITIKQNGRVGIGTSTPQTSFHILSTNARMAILQSTNNTNAYMEFISNNGSSAEIGVISGQYRIRTSGTNLRVESGTNSTDQVLINENVSIRRNGFTGFGGVNPNFGIHLPNNAGNIGTVRAFEFSEISDSRIKSDVSDIEYGLDTILSLKPSSYYRHNSSNDDNKLNIHEEGKRDIGLIAQDVEKIIPEIVNVPKNKESELYGLDYSKITTVLIKAIQDQQDIIEGLKSRIDDLEN